ncbi:histidine phosphatase family protein [Pseudonocardia spinosispora]|uniref:histidine phosphatase family protein n=1 Tax=Pseudonocardia spinosispora TaxID=103441 RepID=UPI000405E5C1|nr:histidine phosphatase family protein [Pseudonocardia spinosispora]
MTRLVLVRHGETVWHADNRYAGTTDVELTEHGLEQARQLADWAKSAGLAAIWCSPLSRARRTAEACAEATGMDCQVDERLRELNFGRAEGLTTADMRGRFPVELAAFQNDPVAHHLPDGEHPASAAERFIDCLDDIAAHHPDGRVLVVAHTTAIRLALCSLIGVALSEYRRLFPFVRNCGITEIRVEPGDPTALLQFNTPIISGEPT